MMTVRRHTGSGGECWHALPQQNGRSGAAWTVLPMLWTPRIAAATGAYLAWLLSRVVIGAKEDLHSIRRC